MYKTISFENQGRQESRILRVNPDGSFTSFLEDNANTNADYAAYLAWLAEGNTPEPADPLPEPVQVDPVEKLRSFLAANPDVAAIL